MDWDSDWVEIFRVGDYGAKGRFTSADLDKMVANFQHWKPPLVLGHPQDDSPAMGWAAELKREGDRLLMRPENVQPELRAHVANGRFPNRSIALYTNPKGTGPTVRHVGFLGAMPPEVKGLAPIRFSSSEFVNIEFKMGERNSMNTLPSVNLVAAAAVLGRDISDPATVKLHQRAEQIARERGVSFGEALRQAAAQASCSFGQFTEGQIIEAGACGALYSVVNVDLANRTEAVQREVALYGKKISYAEAQQIVREEDKLAALDRLGTNFAEVSQEDLKAAMGMKHCRGAIGPESVERYRAIMRVSLAAAKRGTKLTYAEAAQIAGIV